MDGHRFNRFSWQVENCYGDQGASWDQNMPEHNAGVWGGKTDVATCVLECVAQQLGGPLKGRGNCNMPALNWCVSFGSCATAAVIDDDPGAFVNPFRKGCRKPYRVVHNKCEDTEFKVCVRVKNGQVKLAPKVGRCSHTHTITRRPESTPVTVKNETYQKVGLAATRRRPRRRRRPINEDTTQ